VNKAWRNLVIIGVLLVAVVVGWELYLTFSGQKGDFSYTLLPIESVLYSDLESHFQQDPKFSIYQGQAAEVEGIDFFK
jgi:hypothetical protein